MSVPTLHHFLFIFAFLTSAIRSFESAKPLCDVLSSTDYAVGHWKLMSHDRAWRYCPDTIASLNPLHKSNFCYDGHRELLKPYVWTPNNCRIPPFNATAFWASLAGKHRVMFVGDSVTAQAYNNVRCWLESETRGGVDVAHERVARRGDASYVDYWHSNLLFVLRHGAIDFQRLDGWQAHIEYGRKVVLVINTGAWYNQQKLHELGFKARSRHNDTHSVSSSAAEGLFRRVVTTLVRSTLAKFRGVVIFRAISPGHQHGCSAVHSALYNWDQFDQRNAFVKQLLQPHANMFFLDIEKLSELRPDAHPGSLGGNDCYHWCSPSPNSVVNAWSDLLARALAQLAERGWPIFEPTTSE